MLIEHHEMCMIHFSMANLCYLYLFVLLTVINTGLT